jgi:hypothetical protein
MIMQMECLWICELFRLWLKRKRKLEVQTELKYVKQGFGAMMLAYA